MRRIGAGSGKPIGATRLVLPQRAHLACLRFDAIESRRGRNRGPQETQLRYLGGGGTKHGAGRWHRHGACVTTAAREPPPSSIPSTLAADQNLLYRPRVIRGEQKEKRTDKTSTETPNGFDAKEREPQKQGFCNGSRDSYRSVKLRHLRRLGGTL